MPQDRSRHAAPRRRAPWHPIESLWRRWNREDLVVLLCGVLAFLSFTLAAPLFHPAPRLSIGNTSAAAVQFEGAPAIPAAPAPIAETGVQPAANSSSPTEAAAAQPPAPQAAGGTTAEAVPEPSLPASAPPVRIRYPSAAFDVAIHPLDVDGEARSSRTIEPPATKDGYWLVPFGTPGLGSANTTYVIGHSWEGADAPFNHLSSAAAVGDHIEVETTTGTINYRVDSITTYVKSGLKDSAVWDMVPNRLVLISCYTEDPWGKNVVVTAYPYS